MAKRRANVDLVTERSDGVFVLVLVEEGPWSRGQVESHLRRLQDRLHDYVDIAMGGLATRYPESKGRPVIIRLDCYDTPDGQVREFFERFADHVRESKEIKRAIRASGNVASIDFEYNWRTLNTRA